MADKIIYGYMADKITYKEVDYHIVNKCIDTFKILYGFESFMITENAKKTYLDALALLEKCYLMDETNAQYTVYEAMTNDKRTRQD